MNRARTATTPRRTNESIVNLPVFLLSKLLGSHVRVCLRSAYMPDAGGDTPVGDTTPPGGTLLIDWGAAGVRQPMNIVRLAG
jgi:hypothetical protein